MSPVISDRERARKRHRSRPGAWLRQLGALIVTLAALVFASLVGPLLERPAPPPVPTIIAEGGTKSPGDGIPLVKTKAPEAAPVQTARRRARGIPLDAPYRELHGDGYDVLSAQELAGISQADDAAARDDGAQFAPAPQAATTPLETETGARGSSDGQNQSRQSGRRTRRR